MKEAGTLKEGEKKATGERSLPKKSKKKPKTEMPNEKQTGGKMVSDEALSLRVSKSLMSKIKEQAEEEGISCDELVVEYLSEAVTLRAWEIMEKKSQMRMSHNLPQRNNSGNRNQRGKGNQRNGMSQGRYQTIMDDKASFLEYVRNQERNRR